MKYCAISIFGKNIVINIELCKSNFSKSSLPKKWRLYKWIQLQLLPTKKPLSPNSRNSSTGLAGPPKYKFDQCVK